MGSEYGDDLWIMANIDLPRDGFFLDLGCAWREMNSNTAFLRKRGWRGLCVDANPIYAPEWKGVETFACAIIGDGDPHKFHFADAPDLSRFGEGLWMPTIKLMTLLQGVPKIDFISLDLEGGEFEALRFFPWMEQKPRVIISERCTHGIGEDLRVRDMMQRLNCYRLVHSNEANDIFLLE